MSWWYVSSPKLTCAVEVNDGRVSGGAPIVRRFIGQPATNLGDWLRCQGEVRFHRLKDPAVPAGTGDPDPPSGASPVGNEGGTGTAGYVYSWGNNQKRATLKGRHCKVLARGAMRSVLIELENGQREVVSYRALRHP